MQLDKVIMAAAGSGKTYKICEHAKKNQKDNKKKILLVTYTNKGVEAIKIEYRKQNQGIIDKNIVIQSWYQFILAELIKPYQSYIVDGVNYIEGLDFSNMYGIVNYKSIGTKERYLSGRNIKANFASEMSIQANTKSNGKVINRLEQIYSHIYIDEVQDMTGYDLEIFDMFFESSINITLVGDYKQATYCTHNSTKHKKVTGTCIIDSFRNYIKVVGLN
jgi:superfamily I DNA/RNA helicase